MSVKFKILGCGSSMGVPSADGFFGNCNLNEQICDTIKDKHICNTDDDCHKDQFCRITSEP